MENWIERNIPALLITLILLLLTILFVPIANAGRPEFGYGGEYGFLVLILFLPWRWGRVD